MKQFSLFGLPAVGWCSLCGRKLTAPKSVDKGIGPACVRKPFLPHVDEAEDRPQEGHMAMGGPLIDERQMNLWR